MIEVKGNTLIITVDEKDKSIFNEIIDLVNSKTKNLNGESFLKLAESYHQIDKDFRFNREEIYNEKSRFCR
jgi:dimeric dUTPase (all-alpha-NTP-PPase superfamily)